MGQALMSMKYGCKASLKIHDPISTQIFCLFVGDALQRFLRLHDRDRMREALEIFRQTPLIGSAKEPLRKRLRRMGWKLCVVCVFCQLNDGLRSQHAIQMLV